MDLERDVERYLTREVERRGGRCVKFIPDNEPGMPDRLLLLPGGVTLWVETKRTTGELRALQQYQHTRLRRLGQRVEAVYTKADVDSLLTGYKPV